MISRHTFILSHRTLSEKKAKYTGNFSADLFFKLRVTFPHFRR